MELIQPILAAAYFIFGVVFLFLAFTIIRDDFSQRLNRITGMMLFFAALGPIFLALGTIIKPTTAAGSPFEESFIYNLFYAWELFFPAFLLFSLVFPVDRLSALRRPRLRYLIFLPHILHLLLSLAFHSPERVLDLLEVESGEGFKSLILEPLSYVLKWVVLAFSLLLSSENTLFSIINLIYIVLAVYFIVRGRALINNPQIRKQSTTIIVGMSAAVGLYTIAFLIPGILSFEIGTAFKTALVLGTLIIGGGSIIWSIISHRFLDVRVIVRQSLVYTITSGILVGLYILLISRADAFITSYFGGKSTILNIAFIVVALILFQPINIQLDNLIKTLFIKTRADYRNVMEQLSRRLISVFEPDRLRAMIEKTLKSTLLVEKIYFILYDDVLAEYAILPSEDFPERIIIDREDLFLGGVNQLNSPVTMDRLGDYRSGSTLAGEMERRRAQLIMPLKDADHLLGFLTLTHKGSGFRYNAEDISMLGIISNQLVTALTNARLYADSLEKQRLDEEMAMARQIQLELLPKSPPVGNNYRICTYSMPSRIVGGDFYDFIIMEKGRFGLVIADVAGKGLPASLLVAQIQATLHSEVGDGKDISKVLYNLNRYVAESTSSEKYATLFYGEFNPESCEFNYSNAGHNHPILIRADGSHRFLSEGGTIIGAFSGMQFEKKIIKLEPDDLLIFYTDGLSEAMNENDEEYGENRIKQIVIEKHDCNAEEILQAILQDMKKFDKSEPPRDDTTIIILKVCQGNRTDG